MYQKRRCSHSRQLRGPCCCASIGCTLASPSPVRPSVGDVALEQPNTGLRVFAKIAAVLGLPIGVAANAADAQREMAAAAVAEPAAVERDRQAAGQAEHPALLDQRSLQP